MLKRRAAAFDNPDYLYDLKHDGFRALLEIDGSEARLVSRNRNRFRRLLRLNDSSPDRIPNQIRD